jgi:gliding motility-associated-like protein
VGSTFFQFLFFSLIFTSSETIFAQIPTSCFEITSILVDGCDGSNEGKNEMFGFQVGPSALNVSDLRIDGAGANGIIQLNKWPNVSNNFLGFCSTPQASANLQILNDAIVQCGELIEPVGGVLPAGAKVIVFTSAEFTPIPSYFENLTETLYVVFQCAGNTNGHFANFNATPGERTLSMTHVPTNCSDAVTYNVSQLVTSAGTNGAEDGGAVAFAFDGTASYFNNGCQAPFTPTEITITGNNQVCVGATLDLSAVISGDYTSLQWSGGNGVFSNATQLLTSYSVVASDAGSLQLTLTATDPCGAQISETINVTVNSVPQLIITPSGSTSFCQGQSVSLTASGASSFSWSTGETTATITANQTDTYEVSASNACGTDTEQIQVTVLPAPTVTITPPTNLLCIGESTSLTVSGATSYVWSNGLGTTSTVTVTPTTTTTFSVTGTTNNCSSSASVSVTVNPLPTIALGNDLAICTGQSVTLAPTGGVSYEWNSGLGTNATLTISPTQTTSYSVNGTDANGCVGTDAVLVTVNPIPTISAGSSLSVCVGESFVLQAVGTGTITWQNGFAQGETIFPTETSVYIVETLENGCANSDTITVVVGPCEWFFELPNVVTPNGDGMNDFFEPVKAQNVSLVELVFFNRWGNELLNWDVSMPLKWDMIDQTGVELMDGTYFYKAIFLNSLEEQQSMHGFFQVINN